PNTRLVLECAHDALEDAGLTTAQMEGSSTGVIVGAKPEDHWDKLTTAASPGASQYDRFYISGAAHSTTSARVAHWLGTTGPISTVDSACASGSMALHQARLLIEAGDCEMAIVAGVTTHLWPGPLLALSDAQMRSPRSQGGCLVLSSEADGYVPSEACVAFILAKRSTADRLGLRTRLELLSSRVGHNGRNTNGIVAPSCRAQEQLLSSILEGRSLSDVTLLELHGTG
ncbi:thiolase-like protein, partial [Jaminaea rosea]